MQTTLVNMTYEIQLEPGEKLALPQWLIDRFSPGRWTFEIRPVIQTELPSIRDHQAFLNSYAAEDETLYDDYTAG